ncbi:hypothetical protein C8J55DRAFT_249955 [Lentinula edodes]|uniref:Uncharacterized protein n=1 Tax=Lentinula lateritia TaxID=40482 RepID=A0A9W9AXY3_9AGAR|nr:hypothetical protein C8J55DRAFT_249955 [Lentinula edodes]
MCRPINHHMAAFPSLLPASLASLTSYIFPACASWATRYQIAFIVLEALIIVMNLQVTYHFT